MRLQKTCEKLTYLEYRHMSENLKPHEAVRRLHEMFTTFKPKGDPSWPMRTLRDVLCDLDRTYSLRYRAMSDQERVNVVRLVLYEACRRYVQASEDDQAALQKYDLIVNLCRAIEQHEQGICTKIRYFETPGREDCWLSSQNVKKGYEHTFPYKNVKEYASVDAQSEIATVLHENEAQVTEVLQAMQKEWLSSQLQIVTAASETGMEP